MTTHAHRAHDRHEPEGVGMTEHEQQRRSIAKSWHIEPGGLVIDGQVFPWHVAAEPGPMVEALGGIDMHILWLPVLVEGFLPQYGTPDGEPVTTDLRATKEDR